MNKFYSNGLLRRIKKFKDEERERIVLSEVLGYNILSLEDIPIREDETVIKVLLYLSKWVD
ncbi:hypothetical protein GWK48_10400 [Metallosphaera tengchongensis]|uniref:Uncharacterized protein n=1 Tax=Metallosphaera tengchongensis TaxID=1532350 RepID=A0A6N0NY06_9CREN|nr:hypothetical protein [Metallosphaera tengchongensis]QKR00743.1 hypothetical protein GWK48_10400 [Metallosphaera tengchongensis]